MNIKNVEWSSDRIETGPLQFGDDWPGTYIRGDRSFYLSGLLKSIADKHIDNLNVLEYHELHCLADLLEQCNLNGE